MIQQMKPGPCEHGVPSYTLCRTCLESGLKEAKLIGQNENPFSVKPDGPKQPDALAVQVGGGHYKKMAIQVVEYVHKNGIGYMEGSAIKYLSRWRDKGGIEDLKKARHFIDLLIEMEEKK